MRVVASIIHPTATGCKSASCRAVFAPGDNNAFAPRTLHICLKELQFTGSLRPQFQSSGFEVHCINTPRVGHIAKIQVFQLVVVLSFSIHFAIQTP